MESILVPGLVSLAGTGLLKLLQRLLPVLAVRDSWICLFLSAGIWGCLVLPVSLAALKRIRVRLMPFNCFLFFFEKIFAFFL